MAIFTNNTSFLQTNFLKLNEKRHKINVKTSKYHRCECLETQMKTDWTLKIENSREQKIRNQKIRRRHQKLDFKVTSALKKFEILLLMKYTLGST